MEAVVFIVKFEAVSEKEKDSVRGLRGFERGERWWVFVLGVVWDVGLVVGVNIIFSAVFIPLLS